MAMTVYSDSQRAHAEIMLSKALTWTRGTRKSDGLAFVIFESSRKNKDGQPIGYYTTERGCTCQGFLYRGACSHQLAVTLEAEQARERFCRPKASYESLFPADEYERPLVDAF